MTKSEYPLEFLREFLVRRQFLVGDGERGILSKKDFELLKDRKLKMTYHRRLNYRAFVEGWTLAKA